MNPAPMAPVSDAEKITILKLLVDGRTPETVALATHLDVDTVGGLLALELGRVPLPGSEVVSHGLRLRAETGSDHRGRVRVGTILVKPFNETDGAAND